MVPDHDQAIEIHSKAGSNEKIVEHCEAVARVARIIARRFADKGIAVDEESIYAAALLHDIGRNRTQNVAHGYVGANLVKEFSVDDKVATIISKHVGAGISSDEAEKLGFPPGDYMPRTLEEKIVCFSDKVVGHDGKVVPFSLEIIKFKKKGLDVARLEDLKASLQSALGEDPEQVLKLAS
jgi:uncharacterized protein (TIGR00295 family)